MADDPTQLPLGFELLLDALEHNPAVEKVLVDSLGSLGGVGRWFDLYEKISEGDGIKRVVDTFLGNKSERAVLAAILMKADYTAQAAEICPDFWKAWGGLDRTNKEIILDILADEEG